jgi:hypothetical protein
MAGGHRWESAGMVHARTRINWQRRLTLCVKWLNTDKNLQLQRILSYDC